jgi:hypothetical protein
LLSIISLGIIVSLGNAFEIGFERANRLLRFIVHNFQKTRPKKEEEDELEKGYKMLCKKLGIKSE